MSQRKRRGVWMAVCLAVFLFRVLGQLYVALGKAPLLPPMALWYSGLIPYDVLLPIQIMLLMVMTVSVTSVLSGGSFLVPQRRKTKRALRLFAYAYLAVMLVRYPAIMVYKPELRWLGQTIPIFTHWCLAAFLLLLTAGRGSGEQANASLLDGRPELT